MPVLFQLLLHLSLVHFSLLLPISTNSTYSLIYQLLLFFKEVINIIKAIINNIIIIIIINVIIIIKAIINIIIIIIIIISNINNRGETNRGERG